MNIATACRNQIYTREKIYLYKIFYFKPFYISYIVSRV